MICSAVKWTRCLALSYFKYKLFRACWFEMWYLVEFTAHFDIVFLLLLLRPTRWCASTTSTSRGSLSLWVQKLLIITCNIKAVCKTWLLEDVVFPPCVKPNATSVNTHSNITATTEMTITNLLLFLLSIVYIFIICIGYILCRFLLLPVHGETLLLWENQRRYCVLEHFWGEQTLSCGTCWRICLVHMDSACPALLPPLGLCWADHLPHSGQPEQDQA